VYSVRSVQRAINLLDNLCMAGEMGVTELSDATGLHKSTVHRLLATLETEQIVRQNPHNGRYRLGLKLMVLGAAATRSIEIRSIARPHLERLAHITGCTVHLGILDRDHVLYIDKIEAEGSSRLYSQIGRQAPLHCTALGKVLTAYLPRAQQQRLLCSSPLRRYTNRTIVEPTQVLQHLKQVARQGYAVDDGEHEDLVHCYAAPILDEAGQAIAAISVTKVGTALPSANREKLISKIMKAAASIECDFKRN
jgi:IclR family KDG regulon transcriptional repressor